MPTSRKVNKDILKPHTGRQRSLHCFQLLVRLFLELILLIIEDDIQPLLLKNLFTFFNICTYVHVVHSYVYIYQSSLKTLETLNYRFLILHTYIFQVHVFILSIQLHQAYCTKEAVGWNEISSFEDVVVISANYNITGQVQYMSAVPGLQSQLFNTFVLHRPSSIGTHILWTVPPGFQAGRYKGKSARTRL